MKKKILFIGLMAMSSFALHAQENNPRIGIKGGLNLSNLYTENADNENMRIGYHAGAFAKLPLNSHFAVQVEALYSTKGAEVDYNNAIVEGVAKFDLDYIDIPLLAFFSITDNVNFHIGPYFGFLTSSKISNDSEGASIFDFEDQLENNDFNTTDIGISAGAGLDFNRISVGGRYNYGLNKVGKEKDFLGTEYTFPDGKNSFIQFYVALNIL